MRLKWLVGFWAFACLAGLLVMSTNQLDEFDPQLKMSAAIGDIHFETKFSHYLNDNVGITRKSVVHFGGQGCFCGTLAKPHINRLSSDLSRQGFDNYHLDIAKHPELTQFIPSIPAVAVIGQNHEVVYLGPYAQGFGCLTGSGFIESLMPKLLSSQSENALLVTDAEGCYCEV